MQTTGTVGAIAANLHEGGRSEILADYLFSGWGTVTPVRRQDDYGVDLYCTLAERSGRRALVRDYFVVQVKSTQAPWLFVDADSIKWLVEHPMPLFLACVNKKAGALSVYHVMPRFMVWAIGRTLRHVKLTPGTSSSGAFVEWKKGGSFSLSAPILRVTLADFMDPGRLLKLRQVFQYWVRLDRENCDLVRSGLPRFRMPPSYRTNELPTSGIGELGNAVPEPASMHRGILTAAEAAECIGGQFARLDDWIGALYAALFVNHLQTRYQAVSRGHVNRCANRSQAATSQARS